jgi:hypothetical protein
LAFCYAFSPRGYSLSERTVVIDRLIGKARFSLLGAHEIRTLSVDDLRGCVRLFGNGGVFGYYGLFRTATLGKCIWYVTNRKNAVVVITDAKTAVFSPDDVDGFIAATRAVALVTEPASAAPELNSLGTYEGRSWAGWLIGAVLLLSVVGLVAFLTLYAPGPPAYTLTPTSLSIKDSYYPFTLEATDVDVRNIQIVDLQTEPAWRPVERTNGFGIKHYQSGLFSVASGQQVRMYKADGKRMVLLPPKGSGVPVLLECDPPEPFVENLKQLWAGAGGPDLK